MKKCITFFTLHLGYGGVEKAVTSLANELCSKYDVEIIATYKLFDAPAFKVDERVKIKYLINNNLPLKLAGYRNLLRNHHYRTLIKTIWEDYLCKGQIWPLFKDTKKGMNLLHKKEQRNINEVKNCKSDIIISTNPYLNEMVGKYGSKTSFKIGWEHNHHHNNKKYIKVIKKSVEELDVFVVVSQKLAKFYQDKVKCKVIGIENFLDEIPKKKTSLKSKEIISVGRLSEEKGVSDLIKVFSIIHQSMPNVKYKIIGDGQERKNITKQIKKYNLENSITIYGFKDQDFINQEYTKSSFFLMGSFTESFGLVLAEAMSYGVPCSAFTSAEGANDLIINGVNGFLIHNRDKEEMANNIINALKNEHQLSLLSKNAKTTSKNFLKEKSCAEWIKLFNEKM